MNRETVKKFFSRAGSAAKTEIDRDRRAFAEMSAEERRASLVTVGVVAVVVAALLSLFFVVSSYADTIAPEAGIEIRCAASGLCVVKKEDLKTLLGSNANALGQLRQLEAALQASQNSLKNALDVCRKFDPASRV